MSIFNYIFDSDWSQRSDIEALKEQNASLADRLSRKRLSETAQETRVAELEQEVGELALLCKTLMRVLLENGICTGREFQSLIKQIDLEDGVADGKVTKQPPKAKEKCSGCGRPVQHNQKHCLYCGEEY